MPPAARAAWKLMAVEAPGADVVDLALIRTNADEGRAGRPWRLYIAAAGQLTYAATVGDAGIEQLLASGLLEELDAGGRAVLQMSPFGRRVAVAYRSPHELNRISESGASASC